MNFRTFLEAFESNFFGLKHLALEINKHLMPYDTGNRVEPDSDTPNQLLFYGGNLPNETKLLNAIKYFLKEMEVGFGNIHLIEKDGSHYYAIPIQQMTKVDTGNYANVKNPELRKRLLDGSVLDVRQLGYEIEPGIFKLNQFIDDLDYVDSKTGNYIWSIGQDKATGEIFAAYDGRYYNPNDPDFGYKTLWLR